ncbi:hypothetical protein DRN62_01665 [Nanoarchaeota archaeon]|nr:MAG: hypothetical protein DRN62_01665 [Nanoarchaeota archaeon]
MRLVNKELCVKCKGRLFCGLKKCPLLEKARFYPKGREIGRELESTSPPSVFIGRYNYPNVNMGILAPSFPVDEPWILDSPTFWSEQEVGIEKVARYRSILVNARTRDERYLEYIQLAALSTRPVDVELKLEGKSRVRGLRFNPETPPMGPPVELKKVELTSEPRVPKKVEEVVEDEIKAEEGLFYLYEHHFDKYYLEKVFSAGLLGIKKRIVPTRWSITATDDILAKKMLEEIRQFPVLDDYMIFRGGHYGNYFTIFFLPDKWSFELFELWKPRSFWWRGEKVKVNSDFEGFYGRKDYAENTGGGYYAARLPIVEYLYEKRRQASVIVVRHITPDYYLPLGVWVVREGVRKALRDGRKSSLEGVKSLLKPFRSRVLDFHTRQKRLFDYEV